MLYLIYFILHILCIIAIIVIMFCIIIIIILFYLCTLLYYYYNFCITILSLHFITLSLVLHNLSLHDYFSVLFYNVATHGISSCGTNKGSSPSLHWQTLLCNPSKLLPNWIHFIKLEMFLCVLVFSSVDESWELTTPKLRLIIDVKNVRSMKIFKNIRYRHGRPRLPTCQEIRSLLPQMQVYIFLSQLFLFCFKIDYKADKVVLELNIS